MKKLKPKYCLVKIIDTDTWKEEFLKEHGITETGTVYLFNKNEVTYCCSPQQTYCLYPLYPVFETKYNTDIQEEMELNEIASYVIQDEWSQSMTEEIEYNLVEDIDRLEFVDVEEQTGRKFDNIDDAIEYCKCNFVYNL